MPSLVESTQPSAVLALSAAMRKAGRALLAFLQGHRPSAVSVPPHRRYEALPDLAKALRAVLLAGTEGSLEAGMEAVRAFEMKYDPPRRGRCKTDQR